ncbi:CheY-like receiver and HTH DNA-binding domain-containing response regulator [Desulfocapsa sulfexigens DSM 10523]|uniref:CheY-like receiver and HTH DNA-binding domain-containing response regulator n=1 Tax=Desulfocapsa sulfexigens (strain DSM 10523 / SB164P1) TaxID=1167006 RepID=M1PPD5_DESSD|nr:response regulator transcription factor [Desulfocapsa sulfexigens]AGF78286.1 CheY-like receiver and HTH DNA-binding domain-containing response regulator [Desulfocapsa sulfexigens DSM 10523]
MTIVTCSANASTRERWRQILQGDHQLFEVSTVAELKDVVKHQEIELILLHRSMVDMNLISSITESRCFVLSDIPDDNEAVLLLKSGAVGYANTYVSPVRLKEAVNTAISGRVWVGQKLMQKIIRGTTQDIDPKSTEPPPEHKLSGREWEVALLVGQGMSNLEIAAELNISESTVKAHIGSIFKKTNTESRLQLALYVKTQTT